MGGVGTLSGWGGSEAEFCGEGWREPSGVGGAGRIFPVLDTWYLWHIAVWCCRCEMGVSDMWPELMLSPAGDTVKLTHLRSACQEVGLEGRKGDWKKDVCLTTVGARETAGGRVASTSGARQPGCQHSLQVETMQRLRCLHFYKNSQYFWNLCTEWKSYSRWSINLKKILSRNARHLDCLRSPQVKRDESGAIHVTKQKHLHLYYDLINFTVSII